MSVRFFKIFSGVFLAHLVVTSLVWVGFSAPFPRPPATFVYEGALSAEDAGGAGEVWQKDKTPDQFTGDRLEAPYFNHWIRLREPSKSSTYDHLGF